MELQQIVNSNNASTGLASLVEEVSPEKSVAYKQLAYTWDLCNNMYTQVTTLYSVAAQILNLG